LTASSNKIILFSMKNSTPKKPATFTLPADLIDRLKAWRARQKMPPPQNAVVAEAIAKFLDENGG
jgi:hypothetical protein